MDRPNILTVEDVKTLLHLGNDKAYKLFHQKDFPSFKFEGKNYVMEDHFYNWLGNLHNEPNKEYILTMTFNFKI